MKTLPRALHYYPITLGGHWDDRPLLRLEAVTVEAAGASLRRTLGETFGTNRTRQPGSWSRGTVRRIAEIRQGQTCLPAQCGERAPRDRGRGRTRGVTQEGAASRPVRRWASPQSFERYLRPYPILQFWRLQKPQNDRSPPKRSTNTISCSSCKLTTTLMRTIRLYCRAKQSRNEPAQEDRRRATGLEGARTGAGLLFAWREDYDDPHHRRC